ncbi:hypothetical protein SYK_27950 [Pseudodesulfovibrio nedwellii]|uniref:Uncharacterized protein n=1 Tax=Pseudodesulfovibrio nedwellii TaxID=2973072 RepID=A0ABN6S9D0_9BACT|nr:hypothetical protein SYK_27950 [Pseudodesulfovibrio nedwellii]
MEGEKHGMELIGSELLVNIVDTADSQKPLSLKRSPGVRGWRLTSQIAKKYKFRMCALTKGG